MHDLIHTLVLVGVAFRGLKTVLWYPFLLRHESQGSGRSVILQIIKFNEILKQFSLQKIKKKMIK